MSLPKDAKDRKDVPMATGLLDYFPDALAAVASLSKVGNDQHNPGEPLHWAREKSTDQADCIVRHLMERGTIDTDGVRHSAKTAWRALALLQLEIEAAESEPVNARREDRLAGYHAEARALRAEKVAEIEARNIAIAMAPSEWESFD